MRVQQSLSGFIATEPRITPTRNGTVRLYAAVGQSHWSRDETGQMVEVDKTYDNLVMFGEPAQEAFQRFRKGDEFIAEGEVETYTTQGADGTPEEREVFIARRIGHNTARTTYAVDRTQRPDLRRHRQHEQTIHTTEHQPNQDAGNATHLTATRAARPSETTYVEGVAQ